MALEAFTIVSHLKVHNLFKQTLHQMKYYLLLSCLKYVYRENVFSVSKKSIQEKSFKEKFTSFAECTNWNKK